MRQIKILYGEEAANEWLEEYRDCMVLNIEFVPHGDKMAVCIHYEEDVIEEPDDDGDLAKTKDGQTP